MFRFGMSLWDNLAAQAALLTTWDTTFNSANFSFDTTKLIATQTGNTDNACRATKSQPAGSGIGQFDATISGSGPTFIEIGLMDASMAGNGFQGGYSNHAISYVNNGTIQYGGTQVASGLPTFTFGDKITTYKIGSLVGFAKNGTPVNSFNTSTGAGGTDITSGTATQVITTAYPFADGNASGVVFTGAFGSW